MGDEGRLGERYRSGEHHVPDGDTTDPMPALSTLGALAAEVRANRRENRLQLKHIDDRLDAFTTQMRDITKSLQQGREHCASHDSAITAVNKRVDRLEEVETHGKKSGTAAHAAQPQHWLGAVLNSTLAPWLILLLILIIFLAAGTGRDASSFNPFQPKGSSDHPTPGGTPLQPAMIGQTK